MKKTFAVFATLLFLSTATACSSPQGTDSAYQFRSQPDQELEWGTAKLMLPESAKEKMAFSPLSNYGPYAAAIRGSLLRLFGEPILGSDAQYEYIIEASDSTNHTWLLLVYEGDSGPSIGGDTDDQSIYPVAIALRDLIERTPPADFEAIFYADEYDSTVTYGCRGGNCYYREEPGNHVP